MRQIHEVLRVVPINTRVRRSEIDVEVILTPAILFQVRSGNERDPGGRVMRRLRLAFQCAEKTGRIRSREKMFRSDISSLFPGGKLDAKPAFRGLDASVPSALGDHLSNMHSLHEKWIVVVRR